MDDSGWRNSRVAILQLGEASSNVTHSSGERVKYFLQHDSIPRRAHVEREIERTLHHKCLTFCIWCQLPPLTIPRHCYFQHGTTL